MRLRPGPKITGKSEWPERWPTEGRVYVMRPAGWWPWLVDAYYATLRAFGWKRAR